MFNFTNDRMILIKDGITVGHVLFKKENCLYIIVQVYVDPVFRGQNMGNVLMNEFCNFLSKNNYKCKNICSYAVKWFEKNTDKHAVLSEE